MNELVFHSLKSSGVLRPCTLAPMMPSCRTLAPMNALEDSMIARASCGVLSVLSHGRLFPELGSRESPRCPRRDSQVRPRSDSPLHHRPRPFHRPISSKNKEAQAFFNQGFQMMYAFARLDAIRSFREAWKRDPDCAICYWGEGWAWGSYLNGPMSADQSPFAYAAMQKAISLKDKATPNERAFIEALSVRYVKDFDVKTRKEQDQAYADAMAKVAAQYPERSRRHHALRRRAVPARAAPRHARRQRAEHQAPARRARVGAGTRIRSIRAPAICTCTPPNPR